MFYFRFILGFLVAFILSSHCFSQDEPFTESPNNGLRGPFGEIASTRSNPEAVVLSKKAFLVRELNKIKDSDATHSDYRDLMDVVIGRASSLTEEGLVLRLESLRATQPKQAIFFEAFFDLENLSKAEMVSEKSYSLLANTQYSTALDDRYLGQLLVSVLHLKRRDVLIGLQTANRSLVALESRRFDFGVKAEHLYDIYSVINNGLILDKSVDLALESTSRLVSLAETLGYELDAFSLSNNLAVLYAYRNDPEISIEIMKSGEPYLEGARPDQKVAYFYSLGTFLNRVGRFDDADGYLRDALVLSPPEHYLPFIYSQLSIVAVERGSLVEAKQLLERIRGLSAFSRSEGLLDPAILSLSYTIAEKEGDYEAAFVHLKAWSDAQVLKLNSEVFENRHEAAMKIAVSSVVSNQRLESFAVESKLKDTIIQREKRSVLFLKIIGLLGVIIAIGLLASLIHQRRMNKVIKAARDSAIAGAEAKSRFLSVMSHEVRTPLNAIIPLAEQLIGMSSNKTHIRLLGIIKTSGEALLFMMENIMLVTNDEAIEERYFVDVDLLEITRSVVVSMRHEILAKDLKVSVKKSSQVTHLLTNKRAIYAIIRNLLSNAVKFTKAGTVSIEYGGDESDMIIVIRDSGEGFDLSRLSEFLQPFVQGDDSIRRSSDGAGIGLAATQGVVRKLGGRLDFVSSHGAGTTVTVTLPKDKSCEHLIASSGD